MTLFEYLESTKNDYDTYDTVFDFCITVCYVGSIDDSYDKFCAELFSLVSVVDESSMTVNWYELIDKNYEQFKEFANKNWIRSYPGDKDDDIYRWLAELRSLITGWGSDGQYTLYLDFLKTLTAV